MFNFFVNANGERNSIVMQEDLQGVLTHNMMMLKYRMQPKHRNITFAKALPDFLGLWNAMGYAARTKHLKRRHNNNAPDEITQ